MDTLLPKILKFVEGFIFACGKTRLRPERKDEGCMYELLPGGKIT